MRITIETTVSEPRYSQKVVLEVPYDDVEIKDMQELLEEVLAGAGYAHESIESIFASYEASYELIGEAEEDEF